LIYSPPTHAEIRYRPSYEEIANDTIYQQYRTTEKEMVTSREGSEYVRQIVATFEFESQLRKLARLSRDWDTYGSEGPSQSAISAASTIGRALIKLGLVPDAVAPSSEGGIAICFLRNEKYADIECFNRGEILAVRYSSQDDPKAWSVPLQNVAIDATAKVISEYLSV
jgi:hypothetical protein